MLLNKVRAVLWPHGTTARYTVIGLAADPCRRQSLSYSSQTYDPVHKFLARRSIHRLVLTMAEAQSFDHRHRGP